MAGEFNSAPEQGDKAADGSTSASAVGAQTHGAAAETSAPAGQSAQSEAKAVQPKPHAGPGLFSRVSAALEELWLAAFAWIPTPLGLALRLFAWRWLFKSCGSARFGTGHGVRMGRGCFVTASDGELVLHDCVALSPNVHVGADAGRIEIGAHTAVGPGTVIRAANHCIARQDVPIMHQGHVPGQIIIEEDVWIGANCVVTPDVRIGRGAVVGAGAVVTRNVAPFSIVGGVPAKLIGMRGQGGQKHWD